MNKFFITITVVFFTLNLLAACDDGGKEKNEYPEEIQRYCELLAPCGVGMYGPDDPFWEEGYATDAWTSEAGCREYLWQMKLIADVEGEYNAGCYEDFLEMLYQVEYDLNHGHISLSDETLCEDYTHNLAYADCYPEGYVW